MIALPGDIPAETISAIIADEAAIGMVNSKTTAVRVIPVPGKKVGDVVEFWRAFGYRTYHALQRSQRGCVYPKRRQNSRAIAGVEELASDDFT